MSVVLQVEHLTKRFGVLLAVNDLSLEVQAGEILGLLGPNGAGKTTSIQMICGLLRPDSGQVFLHGQPLTGGNAAARRRVGVCPQNIVLWERLTCLEQLQFIGEIYGLRAAAARQRGRVLLDEMGLTEKSNQQARTLSGGMQRRLNLIMALVHDPELVVLDEPEAGLDPQSRVKVREYVQSLARRKTVILTTHNMDEAERVADRIAILDHGQLLVLDTPEALKQSVGAGDTLEIGLNGQSVSEESVRQALAALNHGLRFELAQGNLIVRALHAAAMLPAILDALAAAGVHPGDVRVRSNTLEDVFIQLTGRRLRE